MALALASLLFAPSTQAQNQPVTSIDGARNFPAKSKLVEMTVGVFPDATINGQAARFGAGGRILNQDNLIIIPSTIFNKTLRVLIEMDFSGNNINRAWILNDKEMKLAEERASKQ